MMIFLQLNRCHDLNYSVESLIGTNAQLDGMRAELESGKSQQAQASSEIESIDRQLAQV